MQVDSELNGFQEIKEHAGKEFPFNIYPCTIPADFKQVNVHWHQDLEIIAIKKGRGTVTVDRESFPVTEGEAVVVYPGQLHGISQLEQEIMEYENIIFRPSMLMTHETDVCALGFLMPFKEGMIRGPFHIKAGTECYERFMGCIRYIDELCRDRPYGYQLGVKSALFGFLYLLVNISGPALKDRSAKSKEKIKQVLDYIDAHYGEKISVEDGAKLCFYSNSHFMKYFRQYMGMSFTQYLNDYRLGKAREYLLSTREPVTGIAQRCGFDNLSYFNRLFRQKYHQTPGECRRNGLNVLYH